MQARKQTNDIITLICLMFVYKCMRAHLYRSYASILNKFEMIYSIR